MFFKKLFVFIKRDFNVMFTYKSALVFNYLDMFMNLIIFFIFARMFGERMLKSLEGYGGDVISFVVLGSMGWSLLWNTMGSATGAIQQEMKAGTFETLFLTPTSPFTIVSAYTMWDLLINMVSIFLFLITSMFLFEIHFKANYIFTILFVILDIFLMAGLGLMVAGLDVYVKQVGGIVSVVQRLSYFLSGVIFPISVLPTILQPIAKIIPFYYAITALRSSLTGNEFATLFPYLIILSILASVSISLGIYIFKKGINRARMDGSLAYY